MFAKREEESRALQAALDEVAVKNRVQLAQLAETMMKPPMVTLRSKREAMLLAKFWGPDEPIKAENMKKELEREQNAAKKDVVTNVERAPSALEENHGDEGSGSSPLTRANKVGN